MKRLTAVIAAAAFLGAAALAFGADSYTYEAKNGNVEFNHKMHQKAAGKCSACHEGGVGPIEVDKDFGHSTCKNCHKEMNGPTKCNECHKK
ncbi:MAG: cytochrome c3 family protein [Thermodesulfobacteriota bacterium]|jgi:cytochrome c553|nr:cytochrome c3 family protein [Thermodesulfobacteriota bacterium]